MTNSLDEILDAAEKVLANSGSDEAMSHQAIYNLAIENSLLTSSTLAPEVVMRDQLDNEIQQTKNEGNIGRFFRTSDGRYGLSKWCDSEMLNQISANVLKVRKSLEEDLLKFNPYQFERLCGYLLVIMGFENVIVTQSTSDGGIDVKAELQIGNVIRINFAVQIKRYEKNVGVRAVRELRGSLNAHEIGLIITTSDFSKPAKREANDPTKSLITLVNCQQLISLLIKHNVGVRSNSFEFYDLQGLPKFNQ